MRLEGPFGWVFIAVSVILVLLVPTALVFTTSGLIIYQCLLGMAVDLAHGGLPMAPGARAWLGLALVLVPGVLFARETQVRRYTKPIGKFAVLTMLLIFLIPYILSLPGSSFWVMPGTSVDLYVVFRGVLPSLALLVLLPLLVREARILSGDRNWTVRNETADDIQAPDHYRRNLLLVALFWIVILFGPLTYAIVLLGATIPMTFLLGLYYSFQILSAETFGLGVTMLMNGPTEFIVVLLLSSVRLIFVRDVFSYFWGPVSVRRLVIVGFLGEMLPFIMLYLLPILFVGASTAGFAMPFPITPLFGFIFIRLFRPASAMADAVYLQSDVGEGVIRKPAQAPDTIQVPIAYLIRSRLGAIVKRGQKD